MTEYVLIFILLFVVAIGFYLGYERLFTKKRKHESTLYVEALRDLLDGRQEAAFSKLRQVVAADSTNHDAYIRLGQILRENSQPERAFQVHKDLTLRPGLTSEERIAILQQIAADCLETGELKLAEDALSEFIATDSDNHWGHTQRLPLHEKNKAWSAAYDEAAHILRLEGNKTKKPLARYKFQAAEQLYRKREYHQARILYKEALGLDPKLTSAYLAIGDSYRDEDRSEDAVTFWEKLITAVPEQGHLVIDRLKKTLFDLGRFGDIQGICESILEHDSKNLKARSALAEFYEKKGDLTQAVTLLEKAVDDHPEDNVAALELVRVHLESGNTTRVHELLRTWERRRDTRATEKNRNTVSPTASA